MTANPSAPSRVLLSHACVFTSLDVIDALIAVGFLLIALFVAFVAFRSIRKGK